MLDDGRLTDGQGRVVDFKNTVIIMTSNLGAAYLNDMGEGAITAQTRSLVMGAIQGHFPPEFINRIDEIVIYVSKSRPFLHCPELMYIFGSARSHGRVWVR